MRPVSRLFALLLALTPSFGQSYTIDTYVGGGLPANVPAGLALLNGGARSIAFDAVGDLYFSYQNAVLRVDGATGIVRIVAGGGFAGFSGDGGPAIEARFNGTRGIAFDAAGDLYVCDFGNSRIRKISRGVIMTVAGTGTAGFSGDGGPAINAQLNSPSAVAFDAAGNLYVADQNNNRVRRISGGVITTIAGNGTPDFSGDGGSPASAALNHPTSLSLDRSGAIFIADCFNHRVRKISGGIISTVAGSNYQGPNRDNVPATSAQLVFPLSVLADGAGNLWIAAGGIFRVTNGILTNITSPDFGFGGDGGPAAKAQVNSPSALAFDSAGVLFFSDTNNGRIRKIAGGIITTFMGSYIGVNGTNGPALDSQLSVTDQVALDSEGNLYVSAYNQIFRISHGVITTFAGTGPAGDTGDGGPAVQAQLNAPVGLAFDTADQLYFAEAGGNRVRRVSGGIISTIAGTGTPGFSGDNGPATQAQLSYPFGVAVDRLGGIYVADSGNFRVRKIFNGVITTFAGNGDATYSGDNGPALLAGLAPVMVAAGPAGEIYINGALRVRKVWNGVITTFAGTGVLGYSADDVPATAANLGYMRGMFAAADGSVYITDVKNGVIRRIANGTIRTIAGVGVPAFDGDGGPATKAHLYDPSGVVPDTGGNIYVSDTLVVRVLRPAGATCDSSVQPSAIDAGAAGGDFSVIRRIPNGCGWHLEGVPEWLTTISRGATDGAVVSLSLAPNAATARVSHVSIAGHVVTITQAAPPSIDAGGVVNAASSAAGAAIAPGSIASVYGKFPVKGLTVAPGAPVPTTLAGVTLQFAGGSKAPLFAVSPNQINFQVPWELAGTSRTSLTVTVDGTASAPQTLLLAPVAPGIFTTNAQGAGQAAVLDESYRLVDAQNPAIGGRTALQIYCTGLGDVTNRPASGTVAPSDPPSTAIATPRVTVGGADAQVLFAGLAPGAVGEYQINVLVPEASAKGDAVPVVVTMGGVSSNPATIAVH